MSTEKDNELNEQELWDLLQDHEETELSKPAKKKTPAKKPAEKEAPKQSPVESAEAEPKPRTVITEKRKKALVWYLVGLFGIAFVVVLISLILKGNGNQNPIPDSTGDQSAQVQDLYDRINELEDENNTLKAEKEALEQEVLEQQEMMDGLNLMIDEMSNSLEYVEGNNLFADENAEKLARTMAAYETLVRAQAAFIDYDEAVLEAAMAELGENLDLLSQDAINAYYMVIEYMEQPYLGQN